LHTGDRLLLLLLLEVPLCAAAAVLRACLVGGLPVFLAGALLLLSPVAADSRAMHVPCSSCEQQAYRHTGILVNAAAEPVISVGV
jgi:hypothetical protein